MAFKRERKVDIHMLFVFFPLDVIFLDKRKIVLKTLTLKPWLGRASAEKVKYVIELKAGTAAAFKIKKGDKLKINKHLN